MKWIFPKVLAIEFKASNYKKFTNQEKEILPHNELQLQPIYFQHSTSKDGPRVYSAFINEIFKTYYTCQNVTTNIKSKMKNKDIMENHLGKHCLIGYSICILCRFHI